MTGTTVSHYKILEKLGEGGMGVVYKALDENLDRTVAVKVLPAHLSSDETTKARFVQEAKVVGALNHPNILAVHEIDEQDGELFIVMEFVEGRTLRAHIASLKAGEGIPIRQAIDWTIEIADGLRAAHERGIVHRDIKTENIMLTHDGHPKIMDFGIAKFRGGTGMTRTGTSLGTLSYMSPEQAKGLSADERSDIWSLGVSFYEMLTGEVPFRGEHEAALMYLIVHEQPQIPSGIDRRVPPLLDAVVLRMLEKDRALRYQHAGELVHALRDVRVRLETVTREGKTKSIAVLPFANMSNDPDNEYFSDGLTEEIIASLSRLKDMKIIARTTSMQYKGTKKDIQTIGRELGARYLMEGSVRKFRDDLRITAQFIDVDDGTQLWAGTYKGTLADVFDIQEQVSKQIVDALMVKLTPIEKAGLSKRSTLNTEAFDCYLRARDFLYRRTKACIQFAIDLFRKAIELDGRYASAYAGLGEAYATLYHYFERKDDWLDKALESSLKALVYDPTLSEAYASLSLAYFGKKEFDEALTASRKAIELDPNNSIAYWILGRLYRTSDRDREALEMFRKAVAINPDFLIVYSDLSMVTQRLGDLEEHRRILDQSIQVYSKYLSQNPDNAFVHMQLAVDLIQVGKIEEGKARGAKALELSPDDAVMMYYGACFYARLNETDRAVSLLKNAVSTGYENYEWIKRDPDLDGIREDPGYRQLMDGK